LIQKIVDYLEKLIYNSPKFTGSVEMNFKDGVLMDIVKRERVKV
jgi:hypothetical protein